MSENPSIAARVAARWWADLLRRGFVSNDGGDGTAAAVAVLAGAGAPQPTEVIDRFEQLLAERIDARLADAIAWREGRDPADYPWEPYVSLAVDYAPEPPLSDVLAECGLRGGMVALPWKTNMCVERGRVWVSAGYQAEHVDLPLEVPA